MVYIGQESAPKEEDASSVAAEGDKNGEEQDGEEANKDEETASAAIPGDENMA